MDRNRAPPQSIELEFNGEWRIAAKGRIQKEMLLLSLCNSDFDNFFKDPST